MLGVYPVSEASRACMSALNSSFRARETASVGLGSDKRSRAFHIPCFLSRDSRSLPTGATHQIEVPVDCLKALQKCDQGVLVSVAETRASASGFIAPKVVAAIHNQIRALAELKQWVNNVSQDFFCFFVCWIPR